jgi:hypothetical protein
MTNFGLFFYGTMDKTLITYLQSSQPSSQLEKEAAPSFLPLSGQGYAQAFQWTLQGGLSDESGGRLSSAW